MSEEAARLALPIAGVDGRRSSTATMTGVLADSVRRIDPALADEIEGSSRWRNEYVVLLGRVTELSALSPEAARTVASDGLRSMQRRMVLVHPSGDQPLAQTHEPTGPRLRGATVRGTAPAAVELEVPYAGSLLTGDRLSAQLRRWVEAGVVEPSCRTAVEEVIDHPEWLALAGRRMVLLGAAAELSPLTPLARWGADVVAVARPAREVQDRVRWIAEAGAGKVTMPVLPDRRLGADLTAHTLPLLAWLREHRSDGDLVLVGCAYAPGAGHVEVTAAIDLLAERLTADRAPTVLASLATPTDAFVVPAEVAAAGRSAYERRRRRRGQELVRRITGDRLLAPNYPQLLQDGRAVFDGLVPAQGPNYAMAKRVQRWRAVLAEESGHRVSVNVAPPTWTRSVTTNRLLAAAYSGAPRFGIEVFGPDTARVLMAALLVHDLCTPPPNRRHPEELFSSAAAHGGLWRTAYQPRSVLGLAALAGIASPPRGKRFGVRG